MRMEKRQMLWNFGSFADNIAVIGECGETLRYGELEVLSAKLSEVDPRYPLVMMLCRNTFGAISGYAALMGGGYPMLMMSAEAPAEIRRSVLNAYRPGLVFLPEEMRGEYASGRIIRSFIRCIRSWGCCLPPRAPQARSNMCGKAGTIFFSMPG